jgi:SET domain-containing protein
MDPINTFSESDYLYITTSQIPSAGDGLHTAIPIFKDEVISLFKGEILTNKQTAERVLDNTDQYFIAMLDGTIMDSKNTDCFAKYANDAIGAAKSNFTNNSKIEINEEDEVCLVATRKIKAGEEIFCSYGKRYWKKHSVV